MKFCPTCKIEKNENDFTRDVTRLDRKYWCCRICKRAKARKYSPSYLESRQERCRKRTLRTNNYLNELKTKGCSVCGEMTNVCLDFHHKNENEKDFDISSYKNSNFDKIVREVAKCVLVCANCHRKVHAGLITLGD